MKYKRLAAAVLAAALWLTGCDGAAAARSVVFYPVVRHRVEVARHLALFDLELAVFAV